VSADTDGRDLGDPVAGLGVLRQEAQAAHRRCQRLTVQPQLQVHGGGHWRPHRNGENGGGKCREMLTHIITHADRSLNRTGYICAFDMIARKRGSSG